MDTQLWGRPLWDLLSQIGADARRMGREWDPVPFIMLAYSLRYVLPCRYCRDSYRKYIAQMPPEASLLCEGAGPNATLEWIWALKQRVNAKLDRPLDSLPLEKYIRRARGWTCFVCPAQVWDLLLVIAHNYPERGTDDPEAERKRAAHYLFLEALVACMSHPSCFLHELSAYLDPSTLAADDLGDRSGFYAWVSRGRAAWARDSGMSPEQLDRFDVTEAEIAEVAHGDSRPPAGHRVKEKADAVTAEGSRRYR